MRTEDRFSGEATGCPSDFRSGSPGTNSLIYLRHEQYLPSVPLHDICSRFHYSSSPWPAPRPVLSHIVPNLLLSSQAAWRSSGRSLSPNFSSTSISTTATDTLQRRLITFPVAITSAGATSLNRRY